MARRPQVRYFASRNAYYCQIGGKQHKLADGPDDFGTGYPPGPTYCAALAAFADLNTLAAVGTALDGNTVRVICETYLAAIKSKVAPRTFEQRQASARTLCDFYGELPCRDLRPSHIEDVIARRRVPRTLTVGRNQTARRTVSWGAGGVRTFLMSIKTVFAWAVRREILTRSPLASIDVPSAHSASREHILGPSDYAVIAAACQGSRYPALRFFLAALEDTGARPGELCAANCGDFDARRGALVYYRNDVRRADEFRSKVARHKDRVIYFTGEVLEQLRTRVLAGSAADPLFVSHQHQRWTTTGLTCVFRRLRRRTGLTHLVPYSYRHTFATNFLLAGGSVDVLAGLLGNSAVTIRKHYAHLLHQHDAMRGHLEAFKASQVGRTGTAS